MHLNTVFLVLLNVLCILNVANITECALPFGVFPLLTSGWYYKPNPVESVIFGLIVVKVLALRLASVTGILPIPYHLNDLFVRSLGKRSLPEFLSSTTSVNLTMPHMHNQTTHYFTGSRPNAYYSRGINSTAINPDELKAMYRLLLGVRRLDTSDCFLKTLCFLGSEAKNNDKSVSPGDQELIEAINYLTFMEEVMRKSQDALSKPSIMDVFHTALTLGMESKSNSSSSCDRKYVMCTLTENEMSFESIISDLPS